MLDISGWEMLTIAAIGVVIFGPDRLPKLAADAGKLIRTVRHFVHGAKADLARELGPEFADVNLSDLTPRGIVRKTLGADADVFSELRSEFDLKKEVKSIDLRAPSLRDAPPVQSLQPGEHAPWDADAT